MLEIIVARHGQSLGDIEKRFEGRTDFPLTDLGRDQARRLAAYIAEHLPPAHIVCSPLSRTLEVAQIVGAVTGIQPMPIDDLMEFDHGKLAGLTYEEGNRLYPPPAPGERKLHDPICGGESMIDFRARAERCWSTLTSEYGGAGRLMIVSHGGTIDALFQCFLRLPLSANAVLETGDTHIHQWFVRPEGLRIGFLNRREHLLDDRYRTAPK